MLHHSRQISLLWDARTRIPAFFTKTGYGTLVAEGKETREFGGEMYVMESGLVADLSIVKAWKGDRSGNLVFRETARNFNPIMATAARVTVASVHEIVALGGIDPEAVVTPGVFVKRLVRIDRAPTRGTGVKQQGSRIGS